MENKETFCYTYSANQQEEIKKIREKYVPKETDKMEQLRRLDRSVTQKGTAISLAAGIVGAILLGIGMCCTMVWADRFFVPGIIVGIIGIGFLIPSCVLISVITRLIPAPIMIAPILPET